MSNVLLLPGKMSKYKEEGVEPAGFWVGLWHGIAIPLSFMISLFSDHYCIYETNNKGKIYEFGFLLGSGSGLSIVFNL